MDPQRDPVRWLDAASDAPSELRRALESAAGDGGGADALASLASKLPISAGAVVGAGGTVTGGAGAAVAGATKKAILSWKLAVWIAGGAAGIGAATNAVMVGMPEEPAPVVAAAGPEEAWESAGTPGEPVRAVPAASVDANSARSVSLPIAAPAGSPPARSDNRSPARSDNRSPARSDDRSPATPGERGPAPGAGGRGGAVESTARDGQSRATGGAGDSLAAEAKVLLAAKEALAKSPQKALAAADEHGAAFAGGALAEEREVIRIEALVRLGKRDEAAAAAAAFRARHPRSTHLARVERLVRPR